MPDIGAGTINIGVSFQEIYALALSVTLLLSLFYMVDYWKTESVLGVPHGVFTAMNILWFDDLRIINGGDGLTSCAGAIVSIATLSFNPANDSIQGQGAGGGGGGARGSSTFACPMMNVANPIVLEGDANILSQAINIIRSLLLVIFGLIVGCGIGAFRLVIGVGITVYTLMILANILGGFSNFLNFIGKIFG